MTRSEILQISKPILFNTEMVRAIMDGRKTVTRRVVKPQPEGINDIIYTSNGSWYISPDDCEQGETPVKPPYKSGDYLYVRESFSPNYFDSAFVDYRDDELRGNRNAYKADYYKEKIGDVVPEPKWTPSIHMPKEAARIFLRVTDVRVERLLEISNEQIIAEGIKEDTVASYIKQMPTDDDEYIHLAHLIPYMDLWDSTIPPKDRDKYGWAANPWVFVIEFERVKVGG